jgi:hypothetical protein
MPLRSRQETRQLRSPIRTRLTDSSFIRQSTDRIERQGQRVLSIVAVSRSCKTFVTVAAPAISFFLLLSRHVGRTTFIGSSHKVSSGAPLVQTVDLSLPSSLSSDNPMGRGCCSWHGGECGCQDGRDKCCDGTLSPTCTCHGPLQESSQNLSEAASPP